MILNHEVKQHKPRKYMLRDKDLISLGIDKDLAEELIQLDTRGY